MSNYIYGIIAAFLLIFSSFLYFDTGAIGSYWGVPGPWWFAWIFLPLGVAMLALSILGLLRGKPKPKTVTEEELAQAKARLEAMYRHEHGEAPKYPEEESEK